MSDDEVSRLRVPPHSVEAEQSVLGGLLMDNGAWDRAAELLTESDFYSHQHRVIWAAIAELSERHKPSDVVTVLERLQAAHKADDAGGLAYLNALAQSVPSAANMRRYAEIVRERSVLRSLIAACDDGATAAFNPQGKTVAEVLDLVGTKLAQLERSTVRQEPRPLADFVVRQLDRINDIAEGNVTAGWPTGFPSLDSMTEGGFRGGKVYVVAARPSVGKSSFAQALGLKFAANGLPVLMLSQEMPGSELAERALANLGEADYSRLQRGKLNDAEWGGVSDAADRVRDMPFWVDDQAALRLSDIRAKARMVKGLKVLVLDYLQLSAGSGQQRGENRNSEIEEISRGLKALAKQMDIAVVVLSQLNRKVEDRADKRPQLGDLRDSGAIEQDADVVLLLWPARPLTEHTTLVGCEIAKQRGGRKGEFAFDFEGRFQRWRESAAPIKGPIVRRQQEDFE
jgi:replicative DNA helicase